MCALAVEQLGATRDVRGALDELNERVASLAASNEELKVTVESSMVALLAQIMRNRGRVTPLSVTGPRLAVVPPKTVLAAYYNDVITMVSEFFIKLLSMWMVDVRTRYGYTPTMSTIPDYDLMKPVVQGVRHAETAQVGMVTVRRLFVGQQSDDGSVLRVRTRPEKDQSKQREDRRFAWRLRRSSRVQCR